MYLYFYWNKINKRAVSVDYIVWKKNEKKKTSCIDKSKKGMRYFSVTILNININVCR